MIFSDRIRLRAPERSDIPRFVAWFNDPEVIAGLGPNYPKSQADEENWFDEMLKQPASQHPMVIEIRVTGVRPEGAVSFPPGDMPADVDWVPIGNCSFHAIDWRNRSGEVGIVIGEKRFWNQGYGTETMHLLVKHGFETLNLHRIWLRVHATNLRAIRSYEKVGFTHEGRMREAEFKNGSYVDVLLMSILESERNYAPASHSP
jgi:RimJ/RimL family protein N-acetyltransferase